MSNCSLAVLAIAVIVLYPFLVLLTAKLVAYGWYCGKELYRQKEKPNGK